MSREGDITFRRLSLLYVDKRLKYIGTNLRVGALCQYFQKINRPSTQRRCGTPIAVLNHKEQNEHGKYQYDIGNVHVRVERGEGRWRRGKIRNTRLKISIVITTPYT